MVDKLDTRLSGSFPAALKLRRWEFPLRGDLKIDLALPPDLRPSEAERLARFILSLAIDPKLDVDASAFGDRRALPSAEMAHPFLRLTS